MIILKKGTIFTFSIVVLYISSCFVRASDLVAVKVSVRFTDKIQHCKIIFIQSYMYKKQSKCH